MNELNLILRKRLIGKSKVEYMDHYINQFDGCKHGCYYCWGRILKRMDYETWVKPKVVSNAIELLDKELPRMKNKIHRLIVGNATDSYQPIERKIRLTRAILKKLIAYDVRFTTLTKNSLVLRDLDLFKNYEKCCVGFSITTDNDEIRKKYEPHSSSIIERIEAIKNLKMNGIKIWGSIEPILPYSETTKIIRILEPYVDWWVFGKLNYVKINDPNYMKRCLNLIKLADKLNLNYLVKKELRNYIKPNQLKRIESKTLFDFCHTE